MKPLKAACHLSRSKVTLRLKHSTLHSSPKAIGRAALNLRFTRAYSSQMTQHSDHPLSGGLLHHLLTLTSPLTRKGGCFLLPTPTVTNSFYFRKWDALCCPDFPLASPIKEYQRQTEALLSKCKGNKKKRYSPFFITFFIFFDKMRFYILPKCEFSSFSACHSNHPRELHHRVLLGAGHEASR